MNGGKQRRNETTAAPIRGKNRLYESIVKLVVRGWKVIRLEKDQILIKQLFKHIIPYYLPSHIRRLKSLWTRTPIIRRKSWKSLRGDNRWTQHWTTERRIYNRFCRNACVNGRSFLFRDEKETSSSNRMEIIEKKIANNRWERETLIDLSRFNFEMMILKRMAGDN